MVRPCWQRLLCGNACLARMPTLAHPLSKGLLRGLLLQDRHLEVATLQSPQRTFCQQLRFGVFREGVFQKMPALEGQFPKEISVRFAGENHLRTQKNTKQSSAQRFLNDPFQRPLFSAADFGPFLPKVRNGVAYEFPGPSGPGFQKS